MPSSRKLPNIAPCPRPGCNKFREVRVEDNGDGKDNWWVQCRCGWQGPTRSTKRAAIVIWGIRRSDEEAERRGMELAADWLTEQGLLGTSSRLRDAITSGEVTPKRGGRR